MKQSSRELLFALVWTAVALGAFRFGYHWGVGPCAVVGIVMYILCWRSLVEKEKEKHECIRCGKFLIDIGDSCVKLYKLPADLQYPKDVCINCVTDEEWLAVGVSP